MLEFLNTQQSHADYSTGAREADTILKNGRNPKSQMSRGNFKAFVLFVFISILGFSSMAQDVILKKDGSEISTKVLEITDQQIKYKDFDFQSGPIRNINISDVFMITYENGQKEVFNKQILTPTTPEKEILNEQTLMPTTVEKKYNTPSNDLKREFNRIGTNDKEMLNFFKKNNFTEYSYRFESACRASKAGRNLLALGIGGIVGGAVGTVFCVVLFEGEGIIVSSVAMGAGGILTIVSIPVSASAGARKRAIKNDFEREHFGEEGYTYQSKLNFGSTSNGIGLILSF